MPIGIMRKAYVYIHNGNIHMYIYVIGTYIHNNDIHIYDRAHRDNAYGTRIHTL